MLIDSKVDATVVEPAKALDRRTLANPIRDLNVSVGKEFGWWKRHGHNADDVRERVYRNTTWKAVQKGVIVEGQRLPQAVIDKIELCYRTFSNRKC